MDTLEKLYKHCHDEGIAVEFIDFHNLILGLYTHSDKILPTISLNTSILKNKHKTIEVLAEEIGHHATSSGNYASHISTYSQKVDLTKIEEKAIRWACDFLISDDEINDLLKKSMEIYEISEYLDVPLNLVKNKIYFMRLRNKLVINTLA